MTDVADALAAMTASAERAAKALAIMAVTMEKQRAEIERLREAMSNAIKEAEKPCYGDLSSALDYCVDGIDILRRALEGKQ